MKTLLILFLLAISFGAVAQRSSSKHITNDGRQLRIRVVIEEPGRSVHYNRSFDVTDMEAKAVKALENRIIDSLDQVATNSYSSYGGHEYEPPTKQQQYGEQRVSVWHSDNTLAEATQASATSSLSPSDVAPSSVLVREDKENGRLWMQYTFEKDGEELVIERTANVVGKSEREKQAIIKETERSFGIRTGNQ